MIPALLLAARLCASFPCAVEGVEILRATDPAPACAKAGEVIERDAIMSVDAAVAKIAAAARKRGANTVRITHTATRQGHSVATGQPYICGGK